LILLGKSTDAPREVDPVQCTSLKDGHRLNPMATNRGRHHRRHGERTLEAKR